MTAERRDLSHAYMVVSGSEAERSAMAARLARAMVCEGAGERPCDHCRHCRKALAGVHPDIVTVQRELDDKGNPKRELQVGQIRAMLSDAWIRPNEAEKKAYIIRAAQTMNQSAQNALLKMLEEPPGGSCFILCTDNAAALLPTVRSRCVELWGRGEQDTAPDEAAVQRASAYIELTAAGNLPGLVQTMAVWEKLDTEAVRQTVEEICRRLTEMLCLRLPDPGFGRRRLGELLELMARAETYLRGNVGAKHVLGLLAARSIAL